MCVAPRPDPTPIRPGRSDEHRASLHAHAVTDEVIDDAGIITITSHRQHRAVCPEVPAGAVTYPARVDEYVGLDGDPLHVVRPDTPTVDENGRARKYVVAPGSPGILTIPSMLDRIGTARTMIITEGIGKTLAGCSHAPTDAIVVGINGVYGWTAGSGSRGPSGETRLHPDLAAIAETVAQVIIIPDADVETNAAVHAAVRGLATHIPGLLVGRVPQVDGDDHTGLDDHLGAVDDPARALTKIISRAVPIERIERPADPPRVGDLAVDAEQMVTREWVRYTAADGQQAEGWRHRWPWAVRIDRTIVTTDDYGATTVRHSLTGGHSDSPSRTVTVVVEDADLTALRDGVSALLRRVGGWAWDRRPGDDPDIIRAIRATGAVAGVEHRIARTGWTDGAGGTAVYAAPQGAIGGDGPAGDPPETVVQRRMALGSGSPHAAIRDALGVIEACGDPAPAAAVLAMGVAAIAGVTGVGKIWLYGPNGAGKTITAGWGSSIAGPLLGDPLDPPWSLAVDTAGVLKQAGIGCQNFLRWMDDFRISASARTNDAMVEAVEGISREGRRSRLRSTGDGGFAAVEGDTARPLDLITSEQSPSVVYAAGGSQASIERVLSIPVRPASDPRPTLSVDAVRRMTAMRSGGGMADLGAAVIRTIAEHCTEQRLTATAWLAEAEAIRTTVEPTEAEMPGTSPRARQVASLPLAGLAIMELVARHHGEPPAPWSRLRQVIIKAALVHSAVELASESASTERTVEAVRAVLASGRARMADETAIDRVPVIGARRTDGGVALIPTVVADVLRMPEARVREGLGAVAEPGPGGKATHVVRIGSARVRCYVLPPEVWGCDDDD